MPEKIVVKFTPEGTAEIRYPDSGQGKEGDAERNLAWLWKSLGAVEVRGHKPAGHTHEGVEEHAHG